MHAGIAHLIFNMIALAQMGPIVALRFGRDGRALATYLAFYLLCGLIGDAVYLAIHPTSAVPMIGASGAIFGLWGAMARLGPNGSLVPIFSRQVGRETRSAIVSNLVIMAIVLLPALLSGQFGMGGIAWEAHLGGYLAGLLLIGLPVFRARPIDL
jgi:rhomboid protease GluP